MALDLFIGICGALCIIVCTSILLGKLVMWIQEKLRLRREEKELGRIVQQQKRWENLEKELAKLDNSSAIDMAADPKPWAANPVLSTRRDVAQNEIQEAPHTMWCPRCGSHKKHLAHAVGGVPHHKCEDCGQRYKQIVVANPTKPGPVRWDRNAIEAVPAAPSSSDLEGHWPGVIIFDEIAPYPPEEIHIPNKGGWNDTQDEPVTFGGGDFGGSGAGASYDSSADSDSSSTDTGSSSTDTGSSSDYSTSNDD